MAKPVPLPPWRRTVATATEHGASSASARARGSSAVTATELGQADDTVDLVYDLLVFLCDALIYAFPYCSASRSLQEECQNMILEKMEKWSKSSSNDALYNEPALLKHKEIFDILRYDKQGKPRENEFLEWCRNVSAIRATDGTATKYAEASEDQERRWYKILAERMLQDDLRPEQRSNKTYRIRYNHEGCVVLSSKQRSWIGSMPRKRMQRNKVFPLFNKQRLLRHMGVVD